MSATWRSDTPPPPARIGVAGWARAILRGAGVGALNAGGLVLMLVLRLVERPLFGAHRPLTPYITQGVCKGSLAIIGLGVSIRGQPMEGGGAVVANHSSWLDIFVLNAPQRIYFVSKAEVANWPFIGLLARATGTVFIRRERREARAQAIMLRERLAAGHRLLFFPEGTSTDGLRVLPFKTTLFAPFLDDGLRADLAVQPVTARYHAPEGEDPRFYGWWGDMSMGPHLLKVLAAPRQGRVELTFHPPLHARDFGDRKALARVAEAAVRAPFEDQFEDRAAGD